VANSLDLDRDVHGARVVADLEQAFGVDLMEEAANRWLTVGDIYESLRRLLHEGGQGTKICAAAIAQHRLRTALREIDPKSFPRAEDSLRHWRRCTARHLLRQLGRRTRLQMPGHHFSWFGVLGVVMVPLAVVGLLVAVYEPGRWLLPASAMIMAALLLILDPGRLPKRYATLGGLSRQVAALNFRSFIRMGPARRDGEIWEALVEVLAEHGSLPEREIHEDTMLVRDPGARLEDI
jgi:hypothetical protein